MRLAPCPVDFMPGEGFAGLAAQQQDALAVLVDPFRIVVLALFEGLERGGIRQPFDDGVSHDIRARVVEHAILRQRGMGVAPQAL